MSRRRSLFGVIIWFIFAPMFTFTLFVLALLAKLAIAIIEKVTGKDLTGKTRPVDETGTKHYTIER